MDFKILVYIVTVLIITLACSLGICYVESTDMADIFKQVARILLLVVAVVIIIRVSLPLVDPPL